MTEEETWVAIEAHRAGCPTCEHNGFTVEHCIGEEWSWCSALQKEIFGEVYRGPGTPVIVIFARKYNINL